MFILHHLLSTLCLVLPVFFSSVSEPPSHSGTLGLNRDGHTSCHDLVGSPCVVVIPRRAPNVTSAVPFRTSPPSPEPFLSRLALIKAGISELVGRVALSERAVSLYTLCEPRPPFIYSRAAFAAHVALFRVRARYCIPYYLAKQPLRPVSVPPMAPSPPPRLPPPPATKSTGDGPPPTRTRTTSASNPAPPMPAYASMKGRSCTYDYPVVPRTSPAFATRPKRTRPPPLPFESAAIYGAVFGLVCVLKQMLDNFMNQPPESTIRRVVHYAYELTIEGHRFQMKNLWYHKRWEDSGAFDDLEAMEWCAWYDIARTLRRFEKEYASEPFLGMELRLHRTRTVFDVFQDRTGRQTTFIVPQYNHGSETFVNEDHFNFDPDPTSAYVEDPDDAGPDQAGAGGVGGY
ncbi:hypothetical protein FRC07_005201 [Ceratobasidium sp. 392]|nr:hypothetical protein FRC07_005201 [Ceratobasidium sp. 392]